jgi:hypothetical protein
LNEALDLRTGSRSGRRAPTPTPTRVRLKRSLDFAVFVAAGVLALAAEAVRMAWRRRGTQAPR